MPAAFFLSKMETHLIHIGAMVRQLRESKGLSGEQLAERAGLVKSDISKIENGRRNITINTLVRLSSALDAVIDIRLTPNRGQ
jgi:transcriptional regulator with XRE-family HTH domain